jgi:CO dehydrogenase/acetyl-CoA synthase gamma subunit (corrinoid Fe-S protein)
MSGCCCGDEPACCGGTKIRAAATELSALDIWGARKVRFGAGRMNYKIEPGLYAVGKPDENSPVLVSANYKLTFDVLRSELSGIDCWLLILDTNGVNVWCAAGKGTFGTNELVKRVKDTGLAQIVKRRRLILPQLGASNMKPGEVLRRTGFSVVYGPVRAKDI